jgi:hypothetical protein
VAEPVRESCNIRDYVLGLEYLNEEPEGYYHEEGRIKVQVNAKFPDFKMPGVEN